EGYIRKIDNDIKKYKKLDSIKIPREFDYNNIPGLRREFVEKFKKVKPGTLAQAIQIPGVTPSAISILHVYIKKGNYERANKIS
ncbi:MAG: tRNA uridine-5-carboxymethylaminomethyl(34) synthesis enzyme MnmG, partial [Deferribacterota bacterium]|nr:tRNA uridine-5-carboxymethylaminomethyl(34) synthesis enzyme MnmG [Deferribacterota bacterium]